VAESLPPATRQSGTLLSYLASDAPHGDTPVRILYIHQFFATRDSSHPTRSYEFARRMIAAGHEVVMVTGDSRIPELHGRGLLAHSNVEGIEVLSVRNDYSNHMSHPRRILSFLSFILGSTWLALRAPRPDVIFATSTPLTVGVPGMVASRLRRVPLVFEVRDPWPEAAFQMGVFSRTGVIGRLGSWLEREIYRSSTAIIGLSPGMVDCILRVEPDPTKVHMVPNAADLDHFTPGPKDAATEERLGIAGQFVVGYVGAVGPANAPEVIVQASRLLRDRGRSDIAIVIAGDGKRLPAVRALKEHYHLDGLVLTGSVAKHDVPVLLRTCDIILVHLAKVPVLYTGSPNKLFDGLAAGRPIIVNSPGWTRPLVTDAGAGLFVEPEDAVALADAIISLADDPAAVTRMGTNARALAEREFARDDQAARLIAVLARVAGADD
jgi:glycosyltransferase involved in cell wall biosynthesis